MYLPKIYKDHSSIEGIGLFAGEPIPKGTIVFYYSSDDVYVSKREFPNLPDCQKEKLYKFGVEDEFGNWIAAEGDANHSCDANILSMFVDGRYCDIAVKDIREGEEITIDYGLFYSSFPWKISCRCGSPNCRKIVGSGIAVDCRTEKLWSSRISDAAALILHVKQPLFMRDDEPAREMTAALRSRPSPKIFGYLKFSLITSDLPDLADELFGQSSPALASASPSAAVASPRTAGQEEPAQRP